MNVWSLESLLASSCARIAASSGLMFLFWGTIGEAGTKWLLLGRLGMSGEPPMKELSWNSVGPPAEPGILARFMAGVSAANVLFGSVLREVTTWTCDATWRRPWW